MGSCKMSGFDLYDLFLFVGVICFATLFTYSIYILVST